MIYEAGLGQLTGQNGEIEPTDGAAALTATIYHTSAWVSVNIAEAQPFRPCSPD